ncbi:MAG: hypothetical protein CBC48_09100 [bacterium TMED88]|nr:hypothetical protein [Deltaproteobacteria bacterium]OUV31826.1 MAG: hypothetical protein CBC48_09100 [bacterium TMED88]
MHDTVNLEILGIPSVFVASHVFEDGAEKQAKALGAEPAAVYVPHPIQDRTDAEMTDIADACFASLCEALLGR